MLKQISLLILCAAAIVLFATPVQACTSAVVSGKVTPDGRPLLWKNRDTDFMRNHVDYVKGEKYDFIAVVNSVNAYLKEAWMGTNSAGFALMNTQSYNLVDVKGDEERGAANGRVIYRALEVCATVEDFCHFLVQKKRDIENLKKQVEIISIPLVLLAATAYFEVVPWKEKFSIEEAGIVILAMIFGIAVVVARDIQRWRDQTEFLEDIMQVL